MLHFGRQYFLELLPLELVDRLYEAETDPLVKLSKYDERHVPLYNGKTGEVVTQLLAESVRRYSRARACGLLSEGVDVGYGMELADIQLPANGGVTAVVEVGTEHTGDLLVGADTANSFVRTWLLGDEAANCTELEVITYNFNGTYHAETATAI